MANFYGYGANNQNIINQLMRQRRKYVNNIKTRINACLAV